jgi:hypothetical protein
VNVYPFIEAEKSGRHNVARACALLKVSRSAYYAARPFGAQTKDELALPWAEDQVRVPFAVVDGRGPRIGRLLRTSPKQRPMSVKLGLPGIVRSTERNDVWVPPRRVAPQPRIGHRSMMHRRGATMSYRRADLALRAADQHGRAGRGQIRIPSSGP